MSKAARAAVVEDALAVRAQAGLEGIADFLLAGAKKIGVATFQPSAWAA